MQIPGRARLRRGQSAFPILAQPVRGNTVVTATRIKAPKGIFLNPDLEATMDKVPEPTPTTDPEDSLAAAAALMHEYSYSRRYIAAWPHRMQQLLAAYWSGKQQEVEDHDDASSVR